MIEHIVLDYDTSPEVLTYNSLISYKGKKKFRNVKSIEAKVNTQDLTLSFLGPMFPNLERLRLNNSIISSIRDIGCNFPKLRFLSLAQCNITSLDGITTVSPNLQELYLAGNKIPDLIDLMGMSQLRIIDLEDNGISNFSTIEILSFCDKLTALTLKSNPIAVDPNYRKKIFSLLPKLAYLDETRPNSTFTIKQTTNASATSSIVTNNQTIELDKQKSAQVSQNRQNVQQNQQKVQTPQQPKQLPQNNQPNKAKAAVQPTSKPVQQKVDQTKQATQTAVKTTQSNQQKVNPPKPPVKQNAELSKSSEQLPQQKVNQTNQTAQPVKKPPLPAQKKVEKPSDQNSQKVDQTTNTANNRPSNTVQSKKRAPSSSAAENAKKAMQNRQATKEPTATKKVEMPNSSQQQDHSPRKVQMPPTPENGPKNVSKGGSVSKMAEKSPRGSASNVRKPRPNTKLVVSKLGSSAPSTPTKEVLNKEQKPPRPPPKPIPQTVDPLDLFPTTAASPHAKQMSNRCSSQKDDSNQQFKDVKKPLSRSGKVSSARKVSRNDKSQKNEEEIMTDMVHDMVEKNNDESKHNKSCLYERSAFPELNSIQVKKKLDRNVKNPEIIKPLSAKGPLYI